MAINLHSIFHRNYHLGLLEMAFQDTNISKFSGGAFPQTPLSNTNLARFLGWTVCLMPEFASERL